MSRTSSRADLPTAAAERVCGPKFRARSPVRFGRFVCLALALALALCAISSSQLRAANWFEKNFWLSGPRYNRAVPACDYRPALDRIIANFRTKEFRFWNSELRIVRV